MCLSNYYIDVNEKIIYQTFIGELLFEDLINMRTLITSNPLYDHSYHFITDLSKIRAKFSLDDLSRYEEELHKYVKLIFTPDISSISRKSALVVNNPKNFNKVFPFKDIMIEHSKNVIDVGVFETIEEAKNFILK